MRQFLLQQAKGKIKNPGKHLWIIMHPGSVSLRIYRKLMRWTVFNQGSIRALPLHCLKAMCVCRGQM